MRPLELLSGFAEAAIFKEGSPTLSHCPFDNVSLPREKRSGNFQRIETVRLSAFGFGRDEVVVCIRHAPDSLPLRRSRLNKKGASRENKPDEKTC